MSNNNAIVKHIDIENENTFDFDEFAIKLQTDLEKQLSSLQFLKDEQAKIGSSDNLTNCIVDLVWEQCMNQVAVTAGEDFVKKNNGLRLDLSNDAHVQTTENFVNGKLATHNSYINYRKRYNDYQSNFQKDESGNIKEIYDSSSNSMKKVITKEARKLFDENRDMGSASVHKDHTISVAELLRDTELNTHVEKADTIKFANSEKNLNDLDARANMSKGDKPMKKWLNSLREGKTPAERFNINQDDLLEKDKEARTARKKITEEGKCESVDTGRKSQEKEATRMVVSTLKAVAMQLLAALIREIIKKLFLWLKSAQRNFKNLVNHIKEAVKEFVSNLKEHLKNAGDMAITSIAEAIYGPIIKAIKKALILLKQGHRSVQEAIYYIKSPENKNKPIDKLILEVGKIVIAGLSAVGAIALGEVIEKSLMTYPFFLVEIPLLGNLASLIGLFMGGLIAGIIGAIILNLIDKAIAKQQFSELMKHTIDQGNDILRIQKTLIEVNTKGLETVKMNVHSATSERHKFAVQTMSDSIYNIYCADDANTEMVQSDNEEMFVIMGKRLETLSGKL